MKQLHDPITVQELNRMTPEDIADRLNLCEHSFNNKRNALIQFDRYGIEPQDYMFREVAALRRNIDLLKKKQATFAPAKN